MRTRKCASTFLVLIIPVAAFGQTRDTISSLDTVHITAPRTSAYLAEFETRRLMGLGRFLTLYQLDSVKNETLADFASRRFTGLRAVWNLTRTSVSLRSTRGFFSLGQGRGKMGTGQSGVLCEVSVYIDDNPIPSTGMDLASLASGDIAGVEYYSNAPPVKYSRAGAPCGVMVVWTKQ